MDLYGLIHQRYLLTKKGLLKMRIKYFYEVFGICPRVLCQNQPVLPIGLNEELSISRVKVYCPKCEDVYIPRFKFVDIDGAYFGCSFPNIFFQTFPELLPTDKQNKYIPKIYGFRLYGMPGSKYEKFVEEDNKGKGNK